ncbi:MAG: hypothetical protein ACYTG0_35680 [Planctomycetota bacterium]|jgi:hypothetical protein
MNDESQRAAVEARLREEAEPWLRSLGKPTPTAALVAEHRRRARRRRLAGAACFAAGVLAIAAVAGVAGGFRSADGVADRDRPADVPKGPPANDGPDRPTPTPQPLPEVEWPKVVAAIPVFFTVAEGDGHRVIATGIYVPKRVEQVELSDLDPAHQHAVRQVLGIPEAEMSQDSI